MQAVAVIKLLIAEIVATVYTYRIANCLIHITVTCQLDNTELQTQYHTVLMEGFAEMKI